MKKILSGMLAVLFAHVLSAQTAGSIKMNVQNTAGTLSDDSRCPVRMSSMSADVQVMGNIAVTTVDMIFSNDTNRVLEGAFEFPLGENETVIGYALDINGKMRQGVVVEKDKGRQVFEAVVRQGIDPGLVEMTAGNNFKTRVYPIPARGSRHVQLTYQSELKSAPAKDGRMYVYSALSSDVLDSFDFTITILNNKQPASLKDATFLKNATSLKDAPPSNNAVLSLNDMDAGYTAHFSRRNTAVTQPVSIAIPDAYASYDSQSDRNPIFMQDIGKDTFFYYYMPLKGTSIAKKLPKTLAVYYDVSTSLDVSASLDVTSGAKRNFTAELLLLQHYLEKLDTPTVTFIPFSNVLHEARQFSGSAERIVQSIKDYVLELGFDGATNLDYNFASLFPADEVFVFTDGIGTWVDAETEKVAARRPGKMPAVNVVNSSAIADYAWLNRIARENGGVYINLERGNGKEALNEASALESLMQEPYRIIRADYDGTAITDVFPLDGSVVSGDFALTGKLVRKQGTVTLHFGHGTQVEQSVMLSLSTADGTYTSHVARQWATCKIQALGIDYEANRPAIMELSKKFGIVTKDTSLIVLDSVQDYVRYGIVPPDELKAEYDRLVSRQSSGAKPATNGTASGIPQSVYARFEEFRTWWNTNIQDFKKKKKGKEEPIPIPRRPVVPLNETSSASEADAVEAVEYEQSFYSVDAMAAPVIESEPETVSSAQSAAHSATSPRASVRVQSNRAMASTEARSTVSSAKSAGASSSSTRGNEPLVQLQAWSPDAAYLSALKRAPASAMHSTYLDLKKQYGNAPAFYMEVSDYFAEEGMTDESLRILSNLAELELENSDILRALANKLVEKNRYALAVPVFEKLVRIRNEIPQFYRDLGMAYYHAGFIQKAVDTLYAVACKQWDGRFADVQQIALNDMNAIIAEHAGNVDVSAIDRKLLQNFDMDVRIVLTWNTDNCDVDLWVTDADGEKCFYGNKLTANGGRMSRDFTQGYGPEEFCIRTAPRGVLKIEANYYGNHQQKLLQPVTVQAEVYTNFGRSTQKRQVLTLQLDSVKQTFFIGNVEW